MEKLVLIDGHSILNRAFYGVPDLTNSEGLHTNAVYGFLNIMFKLLDEEKPDYLTVAFDVSAPTFRHKMFDAYKGTRKPMADELKQQVPVIKEVLKAMGINIIEKPGFEADDVLGTLAKRAKKAGVNVTLVSGDRDLLQIAEEGIMIRIPKTKGGKTEIENYLPGDVIEKYGVSPLRFIDMKALMGDTADNIPGVPKVGEKTAAELLKEYGTLDGIYENIDSITKKAIKESLINNKDLAYLSFKLATIDTDAPVEFDFNDAKLGNLYTDEAYVLFKKLEFKNMLSMFETKIDYSEITSHFRFIDDLGEAYDAVSKVEEYYKAINIDEKDADPLGISVIYDDKSGENLGVAISYEKETFFAKKWMFISEDVIEKIVGRAVTACPFVSLADVKKVYGLLACDDVSKMSDVIIMAYLNNPLKNDYSLIDIANEYLGMMIPVKAQLFKKKTLEAALNEQQEDFLHFACYEAYVARKAYGPLKTRLSENGLLNLFKDIEMPLARVLYYMEKEGVLVKPDALKAYSDMLGDKIAVLEKNIYEAAGCEFNINSPKQLGDVLFEKLGLPGSKKTKTGYSTAQDVLQKLSSEYEIVSDILEYRAYAKLKSTYADGLVSYIDATNRIHTSFQQTVTATGRLSSTEPNLQNIPIRMELGRQIRKVFVPKDGYVFIDADYSQIELRVLASLSGDERLIKAYSEHADIHRITASQVFNVPFEEVTDLQRRNAKAVNFGIVYGISAFGLGEDLGISQKEAKKYIEDYYAAYPKIKEYIDSLVKDAKDKGYAETYFGRRRPIPELKSSNFMERSFGERVAMNAPIQGTAADIMKIAMINVFNRLSNEGLKARVLLQVHDELLIEAPEDEKDLVMEILKSEMEEAVKLPVKLEADVHSGYDWFEAK